MPRTTRHTDGGSPPVAGLEDGAERMMRVAKSQDPDDVDDTDIEESIHGGDAAGGDALLSEEEEAAEEEDEEAEEDDEDDVDDTQEVDAVNDTQEVEAAAPAPMVVAAAAPVVVAAAAGHGRHQKGPLRRRRKALRDNLQGISKASLRRLARKGG